MPFWLGLGLTLCFVPNVTGVSVLTGWPYLAAILPIFLFWKSAWTPIHWLLLGFIAYVLLSLAWTDNIYDGVGGASQWVILGLAFHYGCISNRPRSLYLGICVGLSVSVAIAIAQSFGWNGVYADGDYRSNVTGLFVNSTVFGTILALSLVAAIFSRIWWYVPIGGLGLFMSGARAAGAAAALSVLLGIWNYSRWLALICLVPATLFCVAVWLNKPSGEVETSLARRSAYWADTAENLTPIGHGVGSFFQLYPDFAKRTDVVKARPEHAYSDILELIFEFGLGTLLLWGALILAWEIPLETERSLLLAFLLVSLTYFPLAIPPAAFLVAFATGQLARGWALVRSGEHISRPDLPYWLGRSGHPYA